MFNIFRKKEALISQSIRETLFGDLPHSQWPSSTDGLKELEPWISFIKARAVIDSGNRQEAVEIYKNITERKELEPRHYLQAWHFLRQLGVNPQDGISKVVYGVILEVSMRQGLDVLAAYSDFSARYYNFSGAGVVWDRPNSSFDDKIKNLLTSAKSVVDQIGLWEKERPVPPPRGQVRLNMLTPSGLYFGQEGSFNVLAKDGLSGPVIEKAVELMQALVQLGK